MLLVYGAWIGGCGGPPAGRIAAAGRELGRCGHDVHSPARAGPGWPAGPRRRVPGPRRRKGRPQGVARATGVPDRAPAREERTGLAGAGVALGSEDAGSQPTLIRGEVGSAPDRAPR